MQEHWQWLEGFVQEQAATLEGDPQPLWLKLEHTRQVFSHAAALAQTECATAEETRALLLAALYHDVARFPQYVQYHTFKDNASRNHGAWAASLLKRHGRLDSESADVRRLVLAAVCFHNRHSLPQGLPETMARICAQVRDADKLDIVRVMAEHLARKPYNPTVVLGLPDSDAANPRVWEMVLAGKTASYNDLWSVNDFRLLLGAWVFDLHSDAARKRFVCAPCIWKILGDLALNEAYERPLSFLRRTYHVILAADNNCPRPGVGEE